MKWRDEQKWCQVSSSPDVWTWSCHDPRFFDLRMLAVRLQDQQLLVCSPIASANSDALNALDQIGQVAAILEPNYYHNLGVRAFRQRYSNVDLYAHDLAIPRLSKITGFEFQPVAKLLPKLPKGLHLACPDGLKQGEIWLCIDPRDDQPGFLIVGDSYLNMHNKKSFLVDKFFRLAGTYPGLSCSRVFRLIAISDREIYLTWIKQFLREHQPTVLIPMHGDIYESASLSSELLVLI